MTRSKSFIDHDKAKYIDLRCIAPTKVALLKQINLYKQFGFRSITVPPMFLEHVAERYPEISTTTIANPCGYNNSNVLFAEFNGIQSLLEDISELEVEFVLPNDYNLYLKEFKEWSAWIRLKPYIQKDIVFEVIPVLPANIFYSITVDKSVIDKRPSRDNKIKGEIRLKAK